MCQFCQVGCAKCLPPRAKVAKMPVAESPVAKCQCHLCQTGAAYCLQNISWRTLLKFPLLLQKSAFSNLNPSPFSTPHPIDMFWLLGGFDSLIYHVNKQLQTDISICPLCSAAYCYYLAWPSATLCTSSACPCWPPWQRWPTRSSGKIKQRRWDKKQGH